VDLVGDLEASPDALQSRVGGGLTGLGFWLTIVVIGFYEVDRGLRVSLRICRLLFIDLPLLMSLLFLRTFVDPAMALLDQVPFSNQWYAL